MRTRSLLLAACVVGSLGLVGCDALRAKVGTSLYESSSGARTPSLTVTRGLQESLRLCAAGDSGVADAEEEAPPPPELGPHVPPCDAARAFAQRQPDVRRLYEAMSDLVGRRFDTTVDIAFTREGGPAALDEGGAGRDSRVWLDATHPRWIDPARLHAVIAHEMAHQALSNDRVRGGQGELSQRFSREVLAIIVSRALVAAPDAAHLGMTDAELSRARAKVPSAARMALGAIEQGRDDLGSRLFGARRGEPVDEHVGYVLALEAAKRLAGQSLRTLPTSPLLETTLLETLRANAGPPEPLPPPRATTPAPLTEQWRCRGGSSSRATHEAALFGAPPQKKKPQRQSPSAVDLAIELPEPAQVWPKPAAVASKSSPTFHRASRLANHGKYGPAVPLLRSIVSGGTDDDEGYRQLAERELATILVALDTEEADREAASLLVRMAAEPNHNGFRETLRLLTKLVGRRPDAVPTSAFRHYGEEVGFFNNTSDRKLYVLASHLVGRALIDAGQRDAARVHFGKVDSGTPYAAAAAECAASLRAR